MSLKDNTTTIKEYKINNNVIDSLTTVKGDTVFRLMIQEDGYGGNIDLNKNEAQRLINELQKFIGE